MKYTGHNLIDEAIDYLNNDENFNDLIMHPLNNVALADKFVGHTNQVAAYYNSNKADLIETILNKVNPDFGSEVFNDLFNADYYNESFTDDELLRIKNIVVAELMLVACLDKFIDTYKQKELAGWKVDLNEAPQYYNRELVFNLINSKGDILKMIVTSPRASEEEAANIKQVRQLSFIISCYPEVHNHRQEWAKRTSLETLKTDLQKQLEEYNN